MSYTALIIVLVLTLGFFLWAILRLSLSPKKKPSHQHVAAAGAPSFNIQVRREEDGIHLVIPDVVPMEDDPESIFPDIINDVAPDTHGLSLDFWQRVASMPDIEDPEQREAIAQALADAGFIDQKNIPAMALLTENASQQSRKEDEKQNHDSDVVENPEPTPEPTPEPEPVPSPSPEPTPEPMPEPTPEPTPEPEPEHEPDRIPPPYTEVPAPSGQSAPEAQKQTPPEEDDFVKREFKV